MDWKDWHGRKANSRQAALQYSCLSPFCRDRKGSEGWKGVRLCMCVCRGGIIDSPPALKTTWSPFISILPCLPSLSRPLHDIQPHTLFLSFTVSTSTVRPSPSPCSSESCVDQRPIGSEHLISRPARLRAVLYEPYSSSCNNPTAPLRSLFFTNQHTLSVALSSSIYASLDRLLNKDDDNDGALQQAGHSLTRSSKTSPLQSRQS